MQGPPVAIATNIDLASHILDTGVDFGEDEEAVAELDISYQPAPTKAAG